MTADEKPRRRRLSDAEHALWRGITRSIAPLKRRPPLPDSADGAPPDRKARPVPAARGHVAAGRPPPAPKPLPALMPLDRRLKQRLARGIESIDARLDLHGQTQSQAHAGLLRFLRNAQAEGAKVVLVITGKGGGGNDFPDERGVLKRQVPLWLTLPEFRAYVAGVEDAHFGHGGAGALYIRMRRKR